MLQLENGSFDTYRVHAELAREHGDWDVFAAVSGMKTDGYRQQSDQSQGRLTLNVGRSFGHDREVRLIANRLNGPLDLAVVKREIEALQQSYPTYAWIGVTDPSTSTSSTSASAKRCEAASASP